MDTPTKILLSVALINIGTSAIGETTSFHQVEPPSYRSHFLSRRQKQRINMFEDAKVWANGLGTIRERNLNATCQLLEGLSPNKFNRYLLSRNVEPIRHEDFQLVGPLADFVTVEGDLNSESIRDITNTRIPIVDVTSQWKAVVEDIRADKLPNTQALRVEIAELRRRIKTLNFDVVIRTKAVVKTNHLDKLARYIEQPEVRRQFRLLTSGSFDFPKGTLNQLIHHMFRNHLTLRPPEANESAEMQKTRNYIQELVDHCIRQDANRYGIGVTPPQGD